MEKEELLIKELAEYTGAEISLGEDKTCELTIDGRVVALRYRPPSDDWLYYCIATEWDDAVPEAALRKALSLNLFGTDTAGLYLGLFGNSLILSGSAAMTDLTAESLAERLVFLARKAEAFQTELNAAVDDEESASDTSPETVSPFSSNFMSV